MVFLTSVSILFIFVVHSECAHAFILCVLYVHACMGTCMIMICECVYDIGYMLTCSFACQTL